MAKERLQKLLAQANIASRRASEDLISRGRVRVNGAVAKVGDKADPASDVIEVDGTRLNFDAQKPRYIMLHKPKHVLTTDKPHRTDKRETVMGLIELKEHLFSIGRLDADSEGLVVMTNDGDLAQRLSHPRFRHSKTYRVEVLGLPNAETLERWQQGIFLEEGKAAPCFIEIVKGGVKGTILRIVMTEGKKRQIRRVAAALGHPVKRLIRTHIGMLALGDLAPGQWRDLTPKEVVALGTPAPEIKTLRAQPRRSAAKAAPTSEQPQAQRRIVRVRKSSAALDEAPQERPVRRARKSAASDEAQQERPTRRARKLSPATDDTQQERPPRRLRKPAPSAGETPEKRRTPRARKPAASDEAQQDRPTRRPRKPAPSAGETPEKRRTPRARKPASPGGTQKKRQMPRDKKPRSRKARPR